MTTPSPSSGTRMIDPLAPRHPARGFRFRPGKGRSGSRSSTTVPHRARERHSAIRSDLSEVKWMEAFVDPDDGRDALDADKARRGSPYLNTKEAARYLGLSSVTLRKRRCAG